MWRLMGLMTTYDWAFNWAFNFTSPLIVSLAGPGIAKLLI